MESKVINSSSSPLGSDLEEVLTVRGMLAYGAEKYIEARVALEDLSMKALTYTLAPSCSIQSLSEEDQFYLSDTYKRQVHLQDTRRLLIDL